MHAHDPCRFDVIIPGEQFFSLKAKSQKERQQWVLALGTLISKGTKSPYSKNRSVERKISNGEFKFFKKDSIFNAFKIIPNSRILSVCY